LTIAHYLFQLDSLHIRWLRGMLCKRVHILPHVSYIAVAWATYPLPNQIQTASQCQKNNTTLLSTAYDSFPNHHLCIRVRENGMNVAVVRRAIAFLRIAWNRRVVHLVRPFHFVILNEVSQHKLEFRGREKAARTTKVGSQRLMREMNDRVW
jgi:hypothetical protein